MDVRRGSGESVSLIVVVGNRAQSISITQHHCLQLWYQNLGRLKQALQGIPWDAT